MKPVGLTNPRDPLVKAYAIVQLRQDNAQGTLWNMVGFQTKLKHAEQVRIFRTIPGLERAEFEELAARAARQSETLGTIHATWAASAFPAEAADQSD